ncbi:MAG: hypothetical protein EXS13_06655 [Planctomycetes bacterium]|nr:hypothetical protein [Planctomycetota bacterium]
MSAALRRVPVPQSILTRRLSLMAALVAGTLWPSIRAQETPAPVVPPPAPVVPPAAPQEKPQDDVKGGDAPEAQGDDEKPKRRKTRKKKAPPVTPGQRWVDLPALGASPGLMRFLDVAATPEGARTQFDPVKEDVAFEVWLDRLEPRPRTIEEPDPEHPGQMRVARVETQVSVLEVTSAEWDEYFAYLKRLTPPGDDSMFMTVLLSEFIEHKAMMLHYRDDLASTEQRAMAAVAKLKAGVAFKDVVRVHSEDETTRSIDGLCLDDERSGMLYLYPFSKVLFELEEVGDIAGPFYNKQAAYILQVEGITRSANMPWNDRYRANGVVIRYPNGPNLKSQQIGAIKMAARVRTEQERLKRIIPPCRQWPSPTTFGPDDAAPLGQADAPLRKRHIDDDKDQKTGGQSP